DLPPLLAPQSGGTNGTPAERWFEDTAQTTPAQRAEAVAGAIGIVEGAGQTAAGIYSTGESFFGMMNSNGIQCEHRETMARFSITAMAADSSGWAKAGYCRRGDLDPLALARRASEKASLSRAPRE